MLRQARRKTSWSRSSASSASPVRPRKYACSVARCASYSSSNWLTDRVGVIAVEDSAVALGRQDLQHGHQFAGRDQLAVEDDLTHLLLEHFGLDVVVERECPVQHERDRLVQQ